MTFLPETGCTEADADCRREEKIGTFTLQTTAQPRLYRRTVLDNQIEEQGFDGKQGWRCAAASSCSRTPRSRRSPARTPTCTGTSTLDKRGVKITLEPTRTTDHDNQPRTLDGIRWQVKDAQEKVLWFDRATGLLREEILEEKVGDEILRQWVLYDDYREIDGVKVAYKIRLINQVDERSQEVVFTTQRVDHQPIPEETFAVPKIPTPKKAEDPAARGPRRPATAAAAAPKDRDAALAYTRAAWAAGTSRRPARPPRPPSSSTRRSPRPCGSSPATASSPAATRRPRTPSARPRRPGVKSELVTAQRAWIHSHQRDFPGVAKALDQLGPQNAALAGRYRTFVGTPLEVKMAGDGCQTEVPMTRDVGPPMLIEIELGGEKTLAMIDTGAADVIVDTVSPPSSSCRSARAPRSASKAARSATPRSRRSSSATPR
jgi:hypothetical protein